MLTVSNLSYLQTTAIARLVEQFQSAMRIDMAGDIKTLKDVIQQLDKILFDDYLKRKAKELAAILQRGILGEGVDWHRAPKPTGESIDLKHRTALMNITEVHGYVYECLLCLVLTHAQISAVAKPLVDRTLAALIDEVSTEALACFQQVPTFGLGGMLQVSASTFGPGIGLKDYRPPWRLNSCTKLYRITSRPMPMLSCKTSTRLYRSRISGNLLEAKMVPMS